MTSVIGAEYKSQVDPTKDTLHLYQTGNLRVVFCDNLGGNRPRYI